MNVPSLQYNACNSLICQLSTKELQLLSCDVNNEMSKRHDNARIHRLWFSLQKLSIKKHKKWNITMLSSQPIKFEITGLSANDVVHSDVDKLGDNVKVGFEMSLNGHLYQFSFFGPTVNKGTYYQLLEACINGHHHGSIFSKEDAEEYLEELKITCE